MNNDTASTLSVRSGSVRRNGAERHGSAQPVVIRLDDVPATAESRMRILERVQRLNRSLEESGTPFRLRLL